MKNQSELRANLEKVIESLAYLDPSQREKDFAVVLEGILLAFNYNEGHVFSGIAEAMKAAAETTLERCWIDVYRLSAERAACLADLGKQEGDIEWLDPGDNDDI